MTARATRRAGWRRIGATVVALVAVLGVLVGPASLPQASAQSPGLEVLGELPIPPCDDSRGPGQVNINVIDIDADARRLYTKTDCGDDRIVVYDISTEIPTVALVGPPIDTEIRTWTSYTVRIAPELGQIFVLGLGGAGDVIVIEIFDLETLEHITTWRMTEEKTRGFVPLGLDYDHDRGRIYLVGTFEASLLVHSALRAQLVGSGGTVPNAAIVAVDAGSGDQIWVNPLRGCDSPLRSEFHGALVAMSAVRPMLYAFCAAGSAGDQPHGQGGIIRLDVSDQGDTEGLADFPSEFFPVSGDYTSGDGVAALERNSERFVAHSLSEDTHGAWVFDGERSSWVGFVASPDNTNAYYGLDPVSGKHYMAGGETIGTDTSFINVTDVGATPVPQGRLFDEIRSSSPWAKDVAGSLPFRGNIMVDPPTGRLFAQFFGKDDEVGNLRGALVLRDTTPPITPRTPLDLDTLTHDLPDDEARLEFSASGSGFGAQYVQVGGWENVYTRLNLHSVIESNLDNLAPVPRSNPANLKYGSRGATMSLVEGVGIASSGSSATAIATQPDDNTPADAETKQNDATNEVDEAIEPVDVDETADETVDSVEDEVDGEGNEEEEADEVGRVTCLDGNGEEALEFEDGAEAAPAYAVVRCDLENLETTAHAHFSGGSGGGGLVVSDTSFDGETYRDPERGVVAESEAVAEGIFFGEADVGGFGIDRVTATATTWANGLDGTSHVKWVRTVEGARTFAADGTASEPESCTTIVESGKETVEEGDCESLAEQLNELIPNRFELKFPLPEVEATPGGAFARVQEKESEYLNGLRTNNDERRVVPGMEMTVFSDGPQRGRLWVQLAAVEARAKFIRSPIFQPDPVDPSTVGAGTASIDEAGPPEPPSTGEVEGLDIGEATAVPPLGGEEPDVAPDEGPPVVTVADEARVVGAFGWLPALRSLGDAVLTGALYIVFLLPLLEVVRRRRLLDVLVEEHAGAS